jgi:hypothetical protein
MGVAYSIFGQFTYLTQSKSKSFEFEGRWFQAVSVPMALQKKQEPWVGVNLINRQTYTFLNQIRLSRGLSNPPVVTQLYNSLPEDRLNNLCKMAK